MIVNLEFIARQAGVSKSLVSKVLNAKPVRVSEQKRQLILDIADKYHYTPNIVASALRTKRTRNIGLLLPTVSYHMFGQLAHSAQQTANALGYNLIIFNSSEDDALERQYLEMYKIGLLDGLIVSPSDDTANLSLFQEMMKAKFPFVFVDRYLKDLPVSYVATDSFSGAYQLARQLIDEGYKDILCVCHGKSLHTSAQTDRIAGYKQAVLEASLSPRVAKISDLPNVEEEEIYSILSETDRPQAILMVSGWDAIQLLKILKLLGLTVPKDIGLTFFDNISLPFAAASDRELVSVIQEPLHILEQEPSRLGEIAARLLIRQIENESSPYEHILLDPVYL